MIPAGTHAEPTPFPGGAESRTVALLTLCVGLGVLSIALFLLSSLAPTAVDLTWINREIIADKEYLKPEPLERFLYITGVLLLPFCLGGAYLGIRRFQRTENGRLIIGRLASPVGWLTAPLFLLLLVAAISVDERAIIRSFAPSGAISLAAAVLLALGATAAAGGRYRVQSGRILRVFLPGLAALLLLAILLFNVLGPEHIQNIPIFWASFNAVFYSVVQVFFGKELLVDFVNQYGLYPHFIEPIFSLVGLSVVSFTAVMGLLNCLAFACMYRFLARESADELLAFLGLTTILFFSYFSGRVTQPDLYLQYHPLRILFPALSLVVVRAFAHAPTPRLGALLFALGAAGALWNPDTGIIVLAAGFLLLVYDTLLRRRPREIPVRLLLGFAAAVAIIASFSCLLLLRFGAFPDYSRLFGHAQAFYIYGVMMLPMPRFGLWIPIVVIYAAGLLLSLAALFEGKDTPRARICFYLSVLGLGLFAYYQGRSVLGNLIASAYPAVMLVVLFTADLRRDAPPRAWTGDRLLSITLLTLLCYSLPALATIAPDWVRAIAGKIRVTRSNVVTEVLRDARFLRSYVHPGQQVVIMSFNSGLHHLLTQTTNPLDIPGDSEIVFRRDEEKQVEYARSGRGTYVVDRTTILASAVDNYRRSARFSFDNPYGTLIVFPAPAVSSSPRGR